MDGLKLVVWFADRSIIIRNWEPTDSIQTTDTGRMVHKKNAGHGEYLGLLEDIDYIFFSKKDSLDIE